MTRDRSNQSAILPVLALFVFPLSALLGCGTVTVDPPPGPQSITGTVVDDSTNQPVGGASVALEQPDASGIDRILTTTTTASDGGFRFNGLQPGNYDALAGASLTSASGAPHTYAATFTFRAPDNSHARHIPLFPEFRGAVPTAQRVQIPA